MNSFQNKKSIDRGINYWMHCCHNREKGYFANRLIILITIGENENGEI